MPYIDKENHRIRVKLWKKKNRDKLHLQKLKRQQKNKQFMWDYKSKHPCKCGEADPCCLHFHHEDPNNKSATISEKTNHWSIKRIQIEIDKCTVMCSNCHLKLHHKQRIEAFLL